VPELRKVSCETTVKILCNKFGFKISGRKGSHVRISKKIINGKIGAVIPLHKELKIGTLKGILRQANVKEEDFLKYS